MKILNQLTPFFLTLEVVAILMNILLIFLALRVPQRPREIRLAIILAIIDISLPLITLCLTLFNYINSQDLKIIPYACQYKGPIEYLGMFFSMLLVTIVAFERVNHIFKVKVPKFFLVLLAIDIFGYCYLVFAVAYYSEYHLLPNGVDCAPEPAANALSTALAVLFGASQFVFLAVTLSCYLSLIFKVLPREGINDQHRLSGKYLLLPRDRRVSVVIRTSLICFTYFLLIVPACILLVVEAALSPDNAEMVTTIIDICLDSIVLANPCLVIFAHSLIYRELSQLFNSFFRSSP